MFLNYGIKISINPDDPGFFGLTGCVYDYFIMLIYYYEQRRAFRIHTMIGFCSIVLHIANSFFYVNNFYLFHDLSERTITIVVQ